MCRGYNEGEGDREQRLKIKAFYVHLLVSNNINNHHHHHDCLTLHLLPRINGSALEINGSNVRPDAPAFLTLHRMRVVVEGGGGGGGCVVVYGSRDRMKASEGLRFEVYMRNDVRVLKGTFRKDHHHHHHSWKVDCSSGILQGDDDHVDIVKEAEVCVALDLEHHHHRHHLVDMTTVMNNNNIITQKVDMTVRKKINRRSSSAAAGKRGCNSSNIVYKYLEEIPEETEEEEEEICGGCCCVGGDGGEEEVEIIHDDDYDYWDDQMDGLRWAVDVGIWVVCLGVGFLVSKASSSSFSKRRTTSSTPQLIHTIRRRGPTTTLLS